MIFPGAAAVPMRKSGLLNSLTLPKWLPRQAYVV
jgi:hypothetical protein